MNKEEQRSQRAMKLTMYWRVGWALLVVFGLMGVFTGHAEQAGYVFVICAVVWTNIKILIDGFGALLVLRDLSRFVPGNNVEQKDDTYDQ